MSSPYADHWEIDPNCTYLNHGSFGPSPTQVRHARQQWSARLENQPMKFFCVEMEEYLDQSAAALAELLHTKARNFALVENATFAMNMVASTVELNAGDEVLLTDHEYGAVKNIWQDKCKRSGAKVTFAKLPYPLNDDETVAAIEGAITEQTKLIVLSHVTSPTAATLPVGRVCKIAKQRGILTAIDGPHAIAMLDVRLDELGCDFYCVSCHKWLCSSFGSGFLWADPKHHSSIRHPIVGWGGSISGRSPSWHDRVNWLGTRDPAPLLSIAAAIDFLNEIGFDTFRQYAHGLICDARTKLLEIEGIQTFCTTNEDEVVSMLAVELPQPANWKPGYHGHPDPLQLELRRDHGIESPVGSWNGRRFLRISAHLYNATEQFDKLIAALNQAKNLR